MLDEDLQKPAIATALRSWYPGRVALLPELRSGTHIQDPHVPVILRQHRGCAFVTINCTDFWLKARPDRRFAVICVSVPQHRDKEAPGMVRRLFRLPEFRSRRGRCGKVILVTTETIRYYERLGGEVRSVTWR